MVFLRKKEEGRKERRLIWKHWASCHGLITNMGAHHRQETRGPAHLHCNWRDSTPCCTWLSSVLELVCSERTRWGCAFAPLVFHFPVSTGDWASFIRSPFDKWNPRSAWHGRATVHNSNRGKRWSTHHIPSTALTVLKDPLFNFCVYLTREASWWYSLQKWGAREAQRDDYNLPQIA